MTADPELAPQISPATRAYAFVFDSADIEDGVVSALQTFTRAVLSALAASDPTGTTVSQIRTGLSSLSEFAARVVGVHAAERQSGRTVSYDMDTYKYVVWEWLDSLTIDWSTIDPEKGEQVFRRRTEECVTLTSLADEVRDGVDRGLRAVPGYVGAFAIDLGNPIHRRGFLDLLCHPGSVEDGTIVQDRTIDDEELGELEGASAFRPGGLVWRPYGWLALEGPPGPAKTPLSPRGARVLARLDRKTARSIETRVIEAIDDAFSFHSPGQAYDYKAVGDATDVLQAILPEGKFTHYLFNRHHAEGGAKSAFFIDVLGIDPEDWRFLAAQFYQGLLLAAPANLELRTWADGYGMRFGVQMRICGRSGVSGIVKTGWMLKPGSLPSLSSAMPGDRAAEAVDPGMPPILPPGRRNEQSWAQLWNWAEAAGTRAAERTVPTPMYLEGYPPMPEGEIGSAAVRVPDARRGLARWLARRGIGHVDGRGGTVAFNRGTGPSLERAKAWSRGAALVLKLNGIDAEVEEYPR